MKLLDTTGGNTKIAKTQALTAGIRLAQLSLHPDNELCPGSKAAQCIDDCLLYSGLAAVYDSVNEARARKTEFFKTDQSGFLEQLRRELHNFAKLCSKLGLTPWVRLNVLSDVAFEKYGIPQEFPELNLYDYTKRAARLLKTPPNYHLMFSYSGAAKYHNQVLKAFETGVPIAAVFRGPMPETFLGREVVNGDKSDLLNLSQPGKIIGLKAKGPALVPSETNKFFVVDQTNREVFENRFFKQIPLKVAA
jgi:hypothetical protein|tara:strand:+ start:421 stop:1167 length:747 start_codon:yes stop_codon:yes gene_type:complete